MSRAALTLARIDLRLTLADRGAMVWMLVMPLVFAAFFGLVMRGGSDPTAAKVHLTVVDEDGGELARMLVDDLANARLEVVEIAPDASTRRPTRCEHW